MRFTLRSLMLLVLIVSVCLVVYSWCNCEIANIKLCDGYSVRFWTELHSWHEPQRQLHGGIYQNGELYLSVPIHPQPYTHSAIPAAAAYHENSNGSMYIRYPGNTGNYVLCDLNSKEFSPILSPQGVEQGDRGFHQPTERLYWSIVLEIVKQANPNVSFPGLGRVITIR